MKRATAVLVVLAFAGTGLVGAFASEGCAYTSSGQGGAAGEIALWTGDGSVLVGPGSGSSSGGSGGTGTSSGGIGSGSSSGAPTGSSGGSSSGSGFGSSSGTSSGGSSSGSSSSSGSGGGGPTASDGCGVGTVGASCAPQPLGPCQPFYYPPANSPGVCTPADVTAFYNDCINSTSPNCSGSDLSTPACFACLASAPSSPTWGAVIMYNNGADFELNEGGCYQLIGASAACAAAEQEESQCEAASCDATCSGSTSTQFDDCITSADTGNCIGYVNAVSANCPSTITGSATCGGTATAFLAAYQSVAQEFCE